MWTNVGSFHQTDKIFYLPDIFSVDIVRTHPIVIVAQYPADSDITFKI